MAIKYTCPKCKGDHVGYDANSTWDVPLQDWVLGGTYDSAWCNDCGEIKELVEVEVPDEAPPAVTVFLLNIHHKHGEVNWAASTAEKRDQMLYSYVRDCWKQERIEGTFNEHDLPWCVTTYFEQMSDKESFAFDETVLDAI
jgi:hypothetical protein